MSSSIAYKDFVDYRAKLNQAAEDLAADRKAAAGNRIRAVKKHLDEFEATRSQLNCESMGRLNHLQKMVREIEAQK